MRTNIKLALAAVTGVALGAAGMAGLHAQQQGGIKRQMLETVDLTNIPNKHAVMAIAEIPNGMSAGHHMHHGQEIGMVLDGTLTLMVDGMPPKELKAGEAYEIPLDKPHDAKPSGGGSVKVLAIYIVDKDKPLAEPVP